MRLSASLFHIALVTVLLVLAGCSVTPSEDFSPINVTNAAQAKTYRDSNAQDLLTGISGWSIPLDSLPLWITGQIGSNDKIVSYNPDGTIKQLISHDPEANWVVSFLGWQQQSGAQVPRLLKIEREDVQIKIQTNQWTAVAAKTK